MPRDVKANCRARAGFTLTEMVVVTGIMAICAAGAALELAASRPVADLNRASWELMAEMRRARLEAICRNLPCTVTIDDEDLTCTTWVDEDGDGVQDEGEASVTELSDLESLSLRVYPDAPFTFNARGQLLSGDPSQPWYLVTITRYGAGRRLIHMYPNGQIDLLDK